MFWDDSSRGFDYLFVPQQPKVAVVRFPYPSWWRRSRGCGSTGRGCWGGGRGCARRNQPPSRHANPPSWLAEGLCNGGRLLPECTSSWASSRAAKDRRACPRPRQLPCPVVPDSVELRSRAAKQQTDLKPLSLSRTATDRESGDESYGECPQA